jgi:hypothetical protein
VSDLGAKIKLLRAQIAALEAMCAHQRLHPVCDDPHSALACDDCDKVVTTGILSSLSIKEGRP